MRFEVGVVYRRKDGHLGLAVDPERLLTWHTGAAQVRVARSGERVTHLPVGELARRWGVTVATIDDLVTPLWFAPRSSGRAKMRPRKADEDARIHRALELITHRVRR